MRSPSAKGSGISGSSDLMDQNSAIQCSPGEAFLSIDSVSCHCPYFPLSARFSYFAFSRVIWTLNHTTKTLLLYYLFSTLLGEAVGIKQD